LSTFPDFELTFLQHHVGGLNGGLNGGLGGLIGGLYGGLGGLYGGLGGLYGGLGGLIGGLYGGLGGLIGGLYGGLGGLYGGLGGLIGGLYGGLGGLYGGLGGLIGGLKTFLNLYLLSGSTLSQIGVQGRLVFCGFRPAACNPKTPSDCSRGSQVRAAPRHPGNRSALAEPVGCSTPHAAHLLSPLHRRNAALVGQRRRVAATAGNPSPL
jgi:hypothetical protein